MHVAGCGGHGCSQEGRVLRIAERQDLKEDHRRRLRPVLGSSGCLQATQERGAMFVIFVAACDFRFCYFGPFFVLI